MAKVKATTQNHLDIADIKNDVVVLKNGGAVSVIQCNAINFDLLSLKEQDAAIAAYSALLNSLSFPIQVTILSKKMDVSEYIAKVKSLEDKQPNAKIKAQIKAYREFIQNELLTKEGVLEKEFYVTIPYKLFTFSESAPLGWIEELIGFKKRAKSKVDVDQIVAEASADLEPKKSFLIKEFARIGIKARALNTSDLAKLYYEIYNSETAQNQKIKGDVSNYTSALVEPKIAS